MYWTGALGGALVVFCGMGLAVGQLTGVPEPECELKVLQSGEEVITCRDGSVSRVETQETGQSDAMDFRGRELDGIDLREFDLRGARFDGAVLMNVEFRGADLTGASFEGATLYFVDLRETKLENVNMNNAVVSRSHLEGAEWSETICPTGILSSENYGTCRGQLSRL